LTFAPKAGTAKTEPPVLIIVELSLNVILFVFVNLPDFKVSVFAFPVLNVLAAWSVTPFGLSIIKFKGPFAPETNSFAVVVCDVELLYSKVLFAPNAGELTQVAVPCKDNVPSTEVVAPNVFAPLPERVKL